MCASKSMLDSPLLNWKFQRWMPRAFNSIQFVSNFFMFSCRKNSTWKIWLGMLLSRNELHSTFPKWMGWFPEMNKTRVIIKFRFTIEYDGTEREREACNCSLVWRMKTMPCMKKAPFEDTFSMLMVRSAWFISRKKMFMIQSHANECECNIRGFSKHL